MAQARIRIVDVREVRAGDLVADDRNCRRHPESQLRGLRRGIGRLGYVAPVLVREDGDRLVIVDGHARASLDPDARIPVCVLDLSAAEAGEAMATVDPLGMMAEGDSGALGALLAGADAEVRAMFRGDDRLSYFLSAFARESAEFGLEPDVGRSWAVGEHRLHCGPDGIPASVFPAEPIGLFHADTEGGAAYAWEAFRDVLAERCAWYVWHARERSVDVVAALRSAGVTVAQELVLLAAPAGASPYERRYRVGQYGWTGGRPKSRVFRLRRGAAETTVWEVGERWRTPLLRHTERAGWVLDPWASVEHVLEAERLGRRVVGAAAPEVLSALLAAPAFGGRVAAL